MPTIAFSTRKKRRKKKDFDACKKVIENGKVVQETIFKGILKQIFILLLLTLEIRKKTF